jgi:O-acetyl-ADP-ribose deacetylase (regulator of RNase III)
MILEKQGNLFLFKHEAYAHGVSNLGRMHAGIAVDFRKKYPTMFKEYQTLCSKKELHPGNIFFYREADNIPVFNLITQDSLSEARVDFLEEAIRRMYTKAIELKITDIAMPAIGCGRGHLNFSQLLDALHPFKSDSRFHITIYINQDTR